MKAEEAREMTETAIKDKEYMAEIYKKIKQSAIEGTYSLWVKLDVSADLKIIMERLKGQGYSIEEFFTEYPQKRRINHQLFISWGRY